MVDNNLSPAPPVTQQPTGQPIYQPIGQNGPQPPEAPITQVTPPDSPKSKRAKRWIVLGVVLLIALTAGAGAWWRNNQADKPATSTKPVVKIGLLAPMTGDNITVGADRKRAIALARQDLNLQNVDIQVVERDSDCDSDTATAAIKEMIEQEGVVAVIGDDCSTSTLAAAKEAEKSQVVLISPAATSPAISSAGDFIFRTVPSDSQQGVFAANLMSSRGFKKVAMLHEDGAYGEGLAESFAANLKEKGISLVDNQVFPASATNVTAPLQHIKASNAEALYIISGDFTSDTAIMLKIKELGIKATLFGSEALKSTTFLQDAGDAAEGLTITAVTDGTSSFKAKYRAAYNAPAGDYIAQAYDAYTALALVIKNGARSGEQIKLALNSISFDGASGHIKFDSKGDVSGNYEVIEVKDKQFTTVVQAGLEE